MSHKVKKQRLFGKKHRGPNNLPIVWGEITLDNGKVYDFQLILSGNTPFVRLYKDGTQRLVNIKAENRRPILEHLMEHYGEALLALNKVTA